MSISVVLTAIVAATLAGAAVVRAAEPEYPKRTVRLLVANLAGGTSAILARQIGAKPADTRRQQFSWGKPIRDTGYKLL